MQRVICTHLNLQYSFVNINNIMLRRKHFNQNIMFVPSGVASPEGLVGHHCMRTSCNNQHAKHAAAIGGPGGMPPQEIFENYMLRLNLVAFCS